MVFALSLKYLNTAFTQLKPFPVPESCLDNTEASLTSLRGVTGADNSRTVTSFLLAVLCFGSQELKYIYNMLEELTLCTFHYCKYDWRGIAFLFKFCKSFDETNDGIIEWMHYLIGCIFLFVSSVKWNSVFSLLMYCKSWLEASLSCVELLLFMLCSQISV